MKHHPLVSFGLWTVTLLMVCAPQQAAAQTAQSSPRNISGSLAGFVRDSSGVPQLGATVELLSENLGLISARQFLTNTQGAFQGEQIPPGFYTVRVTLAGFLPTLEKHVRVSANITTTVRIQLESMFASLEQMRRPPTNASVEADDWKWVLRSSPGLRPVLQWDESPQVGSMVVVEGGPPRPRGLMEWADGSLRPGAVSNIGTAPSTLVAYDQPIDGFNHIVFAGQASYDDGIASGGIATVWLPTGSALTGPQTTMVVREARAGVNGPTFRGARLDQSGTIAIGDHLLIRAGGEYVIVGVGASTWSVRPRLMIQDKVSKDWYLDLVYATLPSASVGPDALSSDLTGAEAPNALRNAINQLDAFPTVLWRNGRPELENGRHSEVSAERKLGSRSYVQVASFHDDDRHVAVFGRGNDLPASDYLQDFYSQGFAYDAGSSTSWGGRLALRERISDNLELTTIYAFSGALVPVAEMDGALRESLRTAERQSMATKVTGTIPKTHTRVSVGYKWVSSAALSRVDPYGESIYGVSPYLNVAIRQPLPRFALGRWEANAECDNVLGQGYMAINAGEGQIVMTPAPRSFRGGLSLQF